MKKSSSKLIIICIVLMSGSYIFPFWRINLEAPQYPEGLEMKIWLNHLSGDVSKVNGLNHYIGMKLIKEDEFSEFQVIPWVLAILLLAGLIAAVLKWRKVLYAWVLLLVAGGVIAFVDFYNWEYDYGHNLNPNAAIRVPGMSYQPPLFGYKQLLNFTAGSLPDTGAYLLIVPALIIIGLLGYEYFRQKNTLTT
jgi:copper chaperone NosL